MAGKTMIKILMLLALAALATGCSSDDPAAVASIDTAPPAVPTNLTADYSAGNRVVTLTWDPNTVDADLAGYVVDKVYRDQTTTLVANPISVPSWQDDAVGSGLTTYHVYAVDLVGNESAVATATISVFASHPTADIATF
jgi:hypothetical protein